MSIARPVYFYEQPDGTYLVTSDHVTYEKVGQAEAEKRWSTGSGIISDGGPIDIDYLRRNP